MSSGFRGRLRRVLVGAAGPSQWQRLVAEGIVSAGPGTYGVDGVHVHEFRAPDGSWMEGRVSIGNYCSIAPCEIFVGGNHRSDHVAQYPFRMRWDLPDAVHDTVGNGDVVIGHDVWLGHGCTIMSGVTIGTGAVIAARAVVTKDVRPYAVVGGNPAREIRRRFDDDTVDRLIAVSWWDWPEERIRAQLPMLTNPPADSDA